MVGRLLDVRREHFGDGVRVLDIGANIGVFTVEWSKHMAGWGVVVAFEAQERIFHALCGNIAINNCFNARTIFAAVTGQPGTMSVPMPNYFQPGSFGSLDLRQKEQTEDIGQPIDYSEAHTMNVPTVSIDALNFPRLDLLKIDVEGMEMEVLEGARQIDRSVSSHHGHRNDQDGPAGVERIPGALRLPVLCFGIESCGHPLRRSDAGGCQGAPGSHYVSCPGHGLPAD